jgi:hypothetical protein
MKPNEWVPILHMAARTKESSLVQFLIKSGANLNLLPDAEAEQLEPLLFICDEIYFKYFVEHGCQVKSEHKGVNILRRLRCADIRRLTLLVKTRILTVQDILSAGDTVLYSLTAMKDYLTYAFNIRQNLINLTEELNQVISKFMKSITQLLAWGASVNSEAQKFAVNHYLYEFLALPAFTTELPVPYHEFMDKLTVAMLRPLLNDARYEKTCRVLHQSPCAELYASARDI